MKNIRLLILTLFTICNWACYSQQPYRVLTVVSKAKDHIKMMTCAKPFLERLAAENHFIVDFTDDSSQINSDNLKRYKVFVMLQLAPFDMSVEQQKAMQEFVMEGKGWVGIHAAGLTGKNFVHAPRDYWQWFEDLMGGVVYSPHPKFQKGTVAIEDRNDPITKGLPARFEISDEWYEFDKSPRPQVHVLAVADESTYQQNKPMGDHPIIWTNEHFRRTVYIGIGHDASMCEDPNFAILVKNAIDWAAK